MIEPLLEYFHNIFPLSPALRDRLTSIVKIKVCPKKKLVLREGQTAKEIYYVVSGLARAYRHVEGTEVTTKFIAQGQFLASWESYYKQVPSEEVIEALEDVVLISFPRNELQAVYYDFVEFNFVSRSFFEHHFFLAEQRTAMLRHLRAEQKYRYFLEHYPNLVNRIPLQYIASYMGVTKETLSRVRARMQKKS